MSMLIVLHGKTVRVFKVLEWSTEPSNIASRIFCLIIRRLKILFHG